MIQPDYESVSTILLSYPERFYNCYDDLTSFYDELIALIPNEINIWIITNNNQSIRKLEEKFKHKKIQFLGLKGWDEIWLRDCLGLKLKDAILKPFYKPSYCKADLSQEYLKKINGLSKTIIKECLKKEVIDINLSIDGGNIIATDSSIFFTETLYSNNGIYSMLEVDTLLRRYIGLTPMPVPVCKNDSIGHIDAYLSFVSNSQALISKYPSFPFLKNEITFLDELDEILKVNGIERISFFERPIDEAAFCGCLPINKPCFYSARGNYINFIQLNKTIILPEYNLPTKTETNFYNKKNQETLEDLGFEVLRINCDKLSKYGGVLHCISFTA